MMKFGVSSASEWLFPDTSLSRRRSASVPAARGGYVGFQIKLVGLEKGEVISVSRPALYDELRFEAYRLLDVCVNENTGINGFILKDDDPEPDYVTRRAPFRVYDALKPFAYGRERSKGDVDALYVCFFVPQDARVGVHKETVTVEAGGEKADIKLVIDVKPCVIPEKTSLKFTNWYNPHNIAAFHHVPMHSEAYWDLLRKYLLLMRRAGQNVILVNLGECISEKEESYDFTNAERLIRMALDMGFEKIEGPHVCYRRDWNENEFYTFGERGKPIKADSAEGYTIICSFLKAWRKFLEENGWYDRLIQHVGDEPHDKCSAQYRCISGIVRQCLPGVPIIDAIETPHIFGAVDIAVPKNYQYEDSTEGYEALRACGTELWYYTCCLPGSKYLNRLLDKPLVEVRYLHWGNFKYGLTGFLHWGFNYWRGGVSPFEQTVEADRSKPNRLPAGDTHIVYPGNGEPYSSMRLENHRFGVQDYELLTMLSGKDSEKAKELTARLVRSFNDIEYDTDVLEKVRAELLDALS